MKFDRSFTDNELLKDEALVSYEFQNIALVNLSKIMNYQTLSSFRILLLLFFFNVKNKVIMLDFSAC